MDGIIQPGKKSASDRLVWRPRDQRSDHAFCDAHVLPRHLLSAKERARVDQVGRAKSQTDRSTYQGWLWQISGVAKGCPCCDCCSTRQNAPDPGLRIFQKP